MGGGFVVYVCVRECKGLKAVLLFAQMEKHLKICQLKKNMLKEPYSNEGVIKVCF